MNGEAPLIRRYEPRDEDAVRHLHDDALNDVGAHLGNCLWDDDLHRTAPFGCISYDKGLSR